MTIDNNAAMFFIKKVKSLTSFKLGNGDMLKIIDKTHDFCGI